MKEQSLKGKYCMHPFESTEIHLDGKLHFCCPSWQKIPFGNYNDSSVMEQWNSNIAQEVRASILDGTYKFCNKDICPLIQLGTLKSFHFLNRAQKDLIKNADTKITVPPKNLMLAYDRSCNLSCESCRSEKISYSTDSKEFTSVKDLTDRFTKDFFSVSASREIRLNITGSGDPFGSQAFRQFLEALDGTKFPNLTIDLQTNGVLFTRKMWERLSKIHQNIGQVIVSVDASTENTYLIVRRGGNWNVLLENIKFLNELRLAKKIQLLQINMVVQKRNYREMVDFVHKFLNVSDVIYFSLVDDWNSWARDVFNQQAIWHGDHPEHKVFKDLLKDPVFNHWKVNMGNLTSFRKSSLDEYYMTLPIFSKTKAKIIIFVSLYARKFYNLFILIKKRHFQV